jgi:microcystin-dependent protein
MWASSATVPSGFLLCDGTEVSRTTYSALFSVIAGLYGNGNNFSTFNLPNFTSRMPIGASVSYGVGLSGGSADATVVSHSHTATSSVTDPGHTHTIFNGANLNSNKDDGGIAGTDILQSNFSNTTNNSTTGISVTTSINNTGSSGTGANLPPYLGINFIIKI